ALALIESFDRRFDFILSSNDEIATTCSLMPGSLPKTNHSARPISFDSSGERRPSRIDKGSGFSHRFALTPLHVCLVVFTTVCGCSIKTKSSEIIHEYESRISLKSTEPNLNSCIKRNFSFHSARSSEGMPLA